MGLCIVLLAVQQNGRLVGRATGLAPPSGAALLSIVLALQRPQATLALCSRMVQRGLGSSSLGLALCLVHGPVSAVALQPRRRQRNDVVSHAQQFTVVAGHQHGTWPLSQGLHQPAPAKAVQVVGRLVQHQQIGARQKCPCQRHAHALAAAEPLRCMTLGQVAQPQRNQRLLPTQRHIPPSVGKHQVIGRSQSRLQPRQGPQNRPQARDVGHRGRGRCIHFLRHGVQGRVAPHRPARGDQRALRKSQENTFAAAIGAHQTGHPRPHSHVQRLRPQRITAGQVPGHIVELENGRARNGRSAAESRP